MYFFQFGAERTFDTFDMVHIIVLLITIAISVFVVWNRSKLKDLEKKEIIAYSFAGFLLFLDISFYVWKAVNGQQRHFPVPMHLCSWATYLVALSLILRKDFLFQVSIYYGITGGLLSLLVPDFGGYSFDHMRFYQFFLLHFMILIGPIIQYYMFDLKLKYKYIYITLAMMWVQAGIAFIINTVFESIYNVDYNMMFVIEPPVPLPGFLGVSPVYLIAFSFIFVGLWNLIYYLLQGRQNKKAI